jgi:16S rRNA (cytidine1402-2'-O)-methyltransferase
MSKLYIIPTPIGNLKDMTFRAIEILKDVDYILAEDTRTSSKLLKHYEITNKLVAHHQHNEHKAIDRIITSLQGGESVALISDAGTPAISDPGFLLVRACLDNDIKVECLPGATAFVPALYESPHRLLKTLFQFKEYFGEDRRISISRELTKIYEENKRGTAQELLDYYSTNTLKGEIVIVVEGTH